MFDGLALDADAAKDGVYAAPEIACACHASAFVHMRRHARDGVITGRRTASSSARPSSSIEDEDEDEAFDSRVARASTRDRDRDRSTDDVGRVASVDPAVDARDIARRASRGVDKATTDRARGCKFLLRVYHIVY